MAAGCVVAGTELPYDVLILILEKFDCELEDERHVRWGHGGHEHKCALGSTCKAWLSASRDPNVWPTLRLPRRVVESGDDATVHFIASNAQRLSRVRRLLFPRMNSRPVTVRPSPFGAGNGEKREGAGGGMAPGPSLFAALAQLLPSLVEVNLQGLTGLIAENAVLPLVHSALAPRLEVLRCPSSLSGVLCKTEKVAIAARCTALRELHLTEFDHCPSDDFPPSDEFARSRWELERERWIVSAIQQFVLLCRSPQLHSIVMGRRPASLPDGEHGCFDRPARAFDAAALRANREGCLDLATHPLVDWTPLRITRGEFCRAGTQDCWQECVQRANKQKQGFGAWAPAHALYH